MLCGGLCSKAHTHVKNRWLAQFCDLTTCQPQLVTGREMSHPFVTPSRDNRRTLSPPASASSLRSSGASRVVADEDDGVCAFWLHCAQFFTTQRLGNQEGSSERICAALPDVLQDKLLNPSQRLSAHSADLLSLKRSGGIPNAVGVLSAVLKGALPLSSSNLALQRIAAHTAPGHDETITSSFPNPTRRQVESILALAPSRRCMVHHHRLSYGGWECDASATAALNLHWVSSRLMVAPFTLQLPRGFVLTSSRRSGLLPRVTCVEAPSL